MAFTCKEFLLPSQHTDFLSGKGLPSRRGKCLLCLRYFQHYTYILVRTPMQKDAPALISDHPTVMCPLSQARTDPNFRVGESPLGQVFCNPCSEATKLSSSEEANLQSAASEIPTHSSAISTTDGYLPSAMLFVDEDFVAHRSAREQRIGALTWRPTVRFCSAHYQYVKDQDGLRIIQVGIGVDKKGLHFQAPPGFADQEAGERQSSGNTSATPP